MTGAPISKPFWSKREARWLLGSLILIAAVFAVLHFEILPQFERGAQERLRLASQEIRTPEQAGVLDPALALPPAVSAAFLNVEDGAPFEKLDPAYYGLFRHYSGIDGAALRAGARLVNYALFARAPAEMRGRPTRIRALFGDFEAVALDEKVGSGEFAYRAYLIDPSGDETYVVDLLDRPAGFMKRDLVTVDALFYRLTSYEGRPSAYTGKSKRVAAPWFVARELTHMQQHHPPHMLDAQMLAISAAILVIALLAMSVWVVRHSQKRRLRVMELELARGQIQMGAPHESGTSRQHGGISTRAAPAAAALPARPVPAWTKRAQELSRHREPAASPPRGERAAKKTLVRWVFAGTAVVAALFGYNGYRYIRSLQPGATPEAIDITARAKDAFARAERAESQIREVAKKVAETAAPPTLLEVDVLAPLLLELQASAEQQDDMLIEARAREQVGGAGPDEWQFREHLRVRLWVLDVADLIDSAAKVGPWPDLPGYLVPLWRAHERLDAAGRAQRSLVESSEQGAEAGALRADARALRDKYLEIQRSLKEIETYLEEGLARADLTPELLPDLLPHAEATARVAEALTQLEEILAAKPQ